MRWSMWVALAAVGCGPGDGPPEDDTAETTPDPVVDEPIPEEGPPVVETWFAGSFATLPDYAGAAEAYGRALAVRYLDGSTEVSVQVSGLAPSAPHDVHVHTWPCAYDAGGHYKLDPTVEDTVQTNEIWPSFTTDAEGHGLASLSVSHRLRGDALAVVVHDPDTNDKLACADLTAQSVVGEKGSGTFASFADADPAIDGTLGGSVSLQVNASSTVTVNLSGLDEASSYTAHVHALPCDTNDGGGHYKLDPTIEDTLADNEIWPEIEVAAGGSANSTVTVPHAIRADAQAVVVHRDGPKVGCADLVRESYIAHVGYGEPETLPAAAQAGVEGLRGSGRIERRFDGLTVVEVDLQGLSPNATYPIHLHDRDCAVDDGGGHYKIDPAVADTVEDNELWATVTADTSGSASRAVYMEHIARAEAQSLVVHDEESGDRVACIDLE